MLLPLNPAFAYERDELPMFCSGYAHGPDEQGMLVTVYGSESR